MSSAATGVTVGGSAPSNYFCYQCEGTVQITPSPNVELVCPNCQGSFLEESETAAPLPPPPNPNPFFDGPSAGGFPVMYSTAAGGGEIDLSSLFGGPTDFNPRSPADFNPFSFLNNYLNTLRANGANIQFVIDNPGGGVGIGIGGGGGGGGVGGDFRLPGNLGDYFVGPGLEQLIQQLAENDPNRYGTPPASKSAVQGLPDVKITEELMASDSSQCAVCKDSFEINEEAKQMPCKHIYHADCILPWLEMHNSCPVCRYELPTDDTDYENRKIEPQNSNNTGNASNRTTGFTFGSGSDNLSGGNQENPQTPRTVERRFSISFPWPFRFGAPAETSNSGATGNSDNSRNNASSGNNDNNEDSNAGSGGGYERMEELD